MNTHIMRTALAPFVKALATRLKFKLHHFNGNRHLLVKMLNYELEAYQSVLVTFNHQQVIEVIYDGRPVTETVQAFTNATA